MLLQIALGSGLLVLNVLVMALAALVLEIGFRVAHPWLVRSPQRPTRWTKRSVNPLG